MIGRNGKGEIVFASNVSGEKWQRLHGRPTRLLLATIIVPEGYQSAEEFAEDCGVELVSAVREKITR